VRGVMRGYVMAFGLLFGIVVRVFLWEVPYTGTHASRGHPY
jgi:hypothetical protein